ncbi:MAG: hypothetical protein ABIK28_15200, partial [Planctomycetota bacterium]
PEDHKSFFCAAEGWGLFSQTLSDGKLTGSIQLRQGKLKVKQLIFGNYGASGSEPEVEILLNGKNLKIADKLLAPDRVALTLSGEGVLNKGDLLEVRFTW